MIHDEFARRPGRPAPLGEDLIPGAVLEVGGGLTLALAASFGRPASLIFYYSLGGLLPLAAACLAIAARRAAGFKVVLNPKRRGDEAPFRSRAFGPSGLPLARRFAVEKAGARLPRVSVRAIMGVEQAGGMKR